MVQQLIIVHVGMGFIPGALLIFKCKQTTGDYHKEMNSDNYMQWVQRKLILNLPHNYVFITDNAAYHSVLSKKCPTSSLRKEDMENLLLQNKMPLTGDLLKTELYALIKLHKLRYKRYVLDYVLSAHGHTVLRLAPQHPDLKVTDHVWSDVKQWVEQRNLTLDDVWQL